MENGKVQLIKQSKQLRYYYRHREERLDYQKQYYLIHKQTILTNKQQKYLNNKVKRTQKNISFLWSIYCNAYSLKRLMKPKHVIEAFLHKHGRKRKRLYNVKKRGKIRFHMIPQFSFQIDETAIKPKVHVVYNYPKSKTLVTARQLSIQTAHFLGLKAGDSISWKEKNPYNGKIETHIVCFDSSGLDLSHLTSKQNDLARLVEHRIETGLQGLDLLCSFFFVNNVRLPSISFWRGNKPFISYNPETCYRSHKRQYAIC